MLASATSWAYDFMVDGIYYNKNESNAIVTYRDYDYNSYSGDVVIPSTVTYDDVVYSVTKIGAWAFNRCSGLTSITIPNSVTNIDGNAFRDCSGLTSITIPNGVTSIDGRTFQGCSSLKSVTIPNNVTGIGQSAFEECSALTSVIIGSGVTSIYKDAFNGCSSLASISVAPDNTKYDSRNNCNAIIETESNTLITGGKNTIIPNSVVSIAIYAFHGRTGLTSINFQKV